MSNSLKLAFPIVAAVALLVGCQAPGQSPVGNYDMAMKQVTRKASAVQPGTKPTSEAQQNGTIVLNFTRNQVQKVASQRRILYTVGELTRITFVARNTDTQQSYAATQIDPQNIGNGTNIPSRNLTVPAGPYEVVTTCWIDGLDVGRDKQEITVTPGGTKTIWANITLDGTAPGFIVGNIVVNDAPQIPF